MVSAQIDQQTQEMKFEMQQQTSQLQSTFESVGASISDSVSSAADKVSNSIESLGNKLSIELAEVRWQMVQQNQTLEKILAVLQENRSNEARQLVSQGVRLYVNQQYDKAEERFLRALDFDMTDYQVLMNLAYIELHKENADKSMSYFQDALSLPTSLDSSSKARTLWSMARLHYVNREYQKALLYAEESLKTVYKVEQENPKSIFTLAIYATLAGRKD
jgi:tetratricopeptide (TPR) repeat protein